MRTRAEWPAIDTAHRRHIDRPGKRNTRHLDRRRRLRPRDYATDPTLYGVDPTVAFHCPVGGDEISMRIAAHTHLVLCDWNLDRRPSATAIAKTFGTSKNTISRVSRGTRWPGETLLVALTESRWRRRPIDQAENRSNGLREPNVRVLRHGTVSPSPRQNSEPQVPQRRRRREAT